MPTGVAGGQEGRRRPDRRVRRSRTIPADATYHVAVSPDYAGGSALTRGFVESYYGYFLMPRRPVEGAPWVICYGCDLTEYGRDAESRVAGRREDLDRARADDRVTRSPGSPVLNALYLVAGAAFLWLSAVRTDWIDVARLAGLAYIVGVVLNGAIWTLLLIAGVAILARGSCSHYRSLVYGRVPRRGTEAWTHRPAGRSHRGAGLT